MRPCRSMLALLAAAAAVLAGCTGPSDPTQDPITTLPVIRDPSDLTSANATAPGAHIHDYWGGREAVTVLEAEGGGSYTCRGCNEGMTLGSFQPEEGVIVPQGTGWVNVTLQVDGAAQPDAYEVWVQTAQDGEPWRAGAIVPGGLLRIESTKERNDPPHYVLSLWVFQLRVAGADATFEGSFALQATAHRGLPLEPYPPHPDRWQGATELTLLDEEAEALAYEYVTPGSHSIQCSGGCPRSHALPNGTVVPHDATHVQVRLVYQSGSIPAGLEVAYHGADTRQSKPMVPDEATPTPGEATFTVELAPGEADSPYAPRSLWVFDVWMDDTAPARAWAGVYELHVKAMK